MARLTLKAIRALERPGMYADEPTLYLRVAPGGSKSWVQRLTIYGQRRSIGLGGLALMTLSEAREMALENRRLVLRGGDPRAEKRARRQAVLRAAALPTFAEASEKAIEAESGNWRGGMDSPTCEQWRRSFALRALPAFGRSGIDEINREHIAAMLGEIWKSKPETARKLLRRVRTVFQWALARRFIDSDPTDHVKALLGKQPRSKGKFRALPYRETSEALKAIEGCEAGEAAKLFVRFAILTATRSGEARQADWAEVDFDTQTWEIPAERMKTNTVHRVPLSAPALEVLKRAKVLDDGAGLIFPAPRGRGRPLHIMTGTQILRAAGLDTRCTVHGFRSSFRDWCAETGKSREVAEAALSHAVPGVEGRYLRTDLVDPRRRLMDQWAQFAAGGESAQVVELRSHAS